MTRAFDDPSELSPEQRLQEVAIILATGILRLKQRSAATGLAANIHESESPGLEVSTEIVLSGDIGKRPQGQIKRAGQVLSHRAGSHHNFPSSERARHGYV